MMKFRDAEVIISELHQRAVYDGMLAGVPNKDVNDSIINAALENTKDIFRIINSDIKTNLIEPERQVVTNQTIGITYETLPTYVTHIYMHTIDRRAVFVLFTNEIGIPDTSIFKTISWFKNSEEFSIW